MGGGHDPLWPPWIRHCLHDVMHIQNCHISHTWGWVWEGTVPRLVASLKTARGHRLRARVHKIDPHKSCYQISISAHNSQGVWGSAVSSPSGVWGRAPAANDFGAFWTDMEASGAIISSTVCSCMTRSSRWIFRKFYQPTVVIFINGIFQSIYVILE